MVSDLMQKVKENKGCAVIIAILTILILIVFVYGIVCLLKDGLAQPIPQARQYMNHIWGNVQPWVGHPDAELRALNIMNSGPGVRFYTNSAQGLGSDQGRLNYAGLAAQLHGLTDKEKFMLYYPYVDTPQYPSAIVNDQTPWNPMAYLDGELNVV